MLHHVRATKPTRLSGFAPNAGLEVTPQFLDAVIRHVLARGYDLVSLGEAIARLNGEASGRRPFAVFTLDDGYEDNFAQALPVFQKHGCPFTIFVSPSIADGTCELWWLGLEAAITSRQKVAGVFDGRAFEFDTRSAAEKQAVFRQLYWPIRNMPEHQQRQWIREFCTRHGVDLDAQCRQEAMTWGRLREIAKEPLCTIGAHTVNHYAIGRLSPEEATAEAVTSRERIAAELGRRPDFFAYPYGDWTSAGPRDFSLVKEAGFAAAVTTRKGLIFKQHNDHLAALPRLSLNGDFQKLRYVDALLSGVPFAMLNGFKRVKTA